MDLTSFSIAVLFFCSIMLFNSILLYPAIILFLARNKNQISSPEAQFPVSIVISAYNEDTVIEDRIKNIFSSDGIKPESVEVLIGSDCSSDRTNEILLKQAEIYPQLRVFLFQERRGKAAVINDLVKYANNPILIFSDANTVFHSSSIKLLVRWFANPLIGGVSGRLILSDSNIKKGESVEEGKYWKMETIIKEAEGKLGILVGANGGIFAIRRELYSEVPMERAVTDDLYISMSILKKNYSFTYDRNAIAFEDVGGSTTVEFRRKTRFSATNYQTIAYLSELLFNRNLLLSYAFWSHKIIRWFMPHLLIGIYIFTGILAQYSQTFLFLFFAETSIVLLGLIGFLLSKLNVKIFLFSIPYYFLIMNVAFLLGFIRFLSKKHTIIWTSTARS